MVFWVEEGHFRLLRFLFNELVNWVEYWRTLSPGLIVFLRFNCFISYMVHYGYPSTLLSCQINMCSTCTKNHGEQ